MHSRYSILLLSCLGLFITSTGFAQRLDVPRQHDRPPGPPVTAEEAVARMTVPEGFHVEIVAAEPDIMNPVAMAIDEQGRYWITESFEYPRQDPGPGRDRIKVLEDTDDDGAVDKVTVFAEGLNIPSGIAVGHGGVWVGNAPDILFLQDTDGDLQADTSEVIVTGFGRTDTHELPNSFIWGPDGWLYGLNGVFNYCDVHYAESNPNYDADHPGWEFTCVMWRIHPRTKEFEVFAEGTSNPWGIATNHQGDFFISACVIDHLWHIVEGAYYIRQGGPYPSHTWPMDSIVRHGHQKAAYCGITYFDSDNYPDYCNNVLYMGNIHGSCLNADVLEPRGSTYFATAHPGFPAKEGAWGDDEYDIIRKTGSDDEPLLADFLQANDPWFMPVVQATGPDGCLYVLDWYDRYHCYQDANADPAGIERERGRLYRIVHDELGRRPVENLGAMSDDQLVDLALVGHNQYQQETARRLLAERLYDQVYLPTGQRLREIVADEDRPTPERLRALWVLMGATRSEAPTHGISSDDPTLQAWLLRNELAQFPTSRFEIEFQSALPEDLSGVAYTTRRQWITELTRLSRHLEKQDGAGASFDHLPLLLRIAQQTPDDQLIQHLVWEVLKEEIPRGSAHFVDALQMALESGEIGGLSPILPLSTDLVLESADSPQIVAGFLNILFDTEGIPADEVCRCLAAVADRVQNRQLTTDETATLQSSLAERLAPHIADDLSSLHLDACILAASWGERDAFIIETLHLTASSAENAPEDRLRAFRTLVFADRVKLANEIAVRWLDVASDQSEFNDFRRQLLLNWARLDDDSVAATLLDKYNAIDPNLRPTVIEVLTQRSSWAQPLLAAIAETIAGERNDNPISKDDLNLNQLRRIEQFDDVSMREQLTAIYGQIREGRNPAREQMIDEMQDFLEETPGDAIRGIVVFNRVCGNCHKMHGAGNEVGPDITRNGRNNWDQLLSNVFDPSLVIGPGYQARQLATLDGRILTGLAIEESDEQVVLKIQGGKLETIPRDQIDEYRVSELSMMPEELEKLIEPQEMADLFAYLALDLPPDDPEARLLPGAPDH